MAAKRRRAGRSGQFVNARPGTDRRVSGAPSGWCGGLSIEDVGGGVNTTREGREVIARARRP
jgi:hypothetical protein